MLKSIRFICLLFVLALVACTSKTEPTKPEPARTFDAVFPGTSLSGAKNALLQACASQGYKVVSTMGPILCSKLVITPERALLIDRTIGSQAFMQGASLEKSNPSEYLSFDLIESGQDYRVAAKAYATVPDVHERVRTLKLEDSQAQADIRKIYDQAGAK
jgi:hypothetical protein